MSGYIDVGQLADYLGITDSDDDTLLGAAIESSSRAIDSWCGRNFVADTLATARVFLPDDNCYRVRVDDFYTTSGLIVKTDDGDNGTYNQTWTITTDYVVEPFNNEVDGVGGWPYYQIAAVGSRYFPVSYIGSGRRPRVQVTAKWGWATVPDPVVQATYLKAARIFRRKNSPESSGGFDGGSGLAVPVIRVNNREDPDVVAMLAPYRLLAVFA